MTSLKVKLRGSAVSNKAGTIFYQITHHRITKHITTNIQLSPHEWDATNEQIKSSVDNKSLIQNRINSDISLLCRIVKDFETNGINYTVSDIINRYKNIEGRISMLDFMKIQIEQMKSANRLGTANNYEKTMRSFKKFLGDINLPFSAVTEQLITEYSNYLIQRGIKRNSVSFYMRNLRAVYNKAVRQKLVEQSHPFADVYTSIDSTRKRAVSEDIISLMNKLKLQEDDPLSFARDIFIFSFCTRGMAFVDIAYLKKSDIQKDVICYRRRKTGQILTVKIESGVQKIINRYKYASDTYVFPILNSTDIKKSYNEYLSAINKYNRLLCKLSGMLSSDCRLSSYTSRHSWATAARNHNVPISIISAGMGHSTEQTTRIYLTSLENSVIDNANKGLIDDIFR